MQDKEKNEPITKTTTVPYKLTIDGGLWREAQVTPALAALKAWAAEGKIEIFESDRTTPASTVNPGWPGGPRPMHDSGMRNRMRAMPKKKSTSGNSFEQVSSVLFPFRDPRKLNMTEINDIVHLLRHQTLGHTVFVTSNVRDFIEQGKRERLQTVFKIVVMTPEETVGMLKQVEGWTFGEDTKKKKKSS